MLRRLSLALTALLAALLALPLSGKAAPAAQSETRADLSAPAVAGELLVKFVPGTARGDRAVALRGAGGQLKDTIEGLEIDVTTFPALRRDRRPEQLARVINALKQNPNVEFVEPNYIYSVSYTPNDPSQGR